MSDVIGDPLETIASGPTVPNHTPNCDVIKVLDRYLCREELPPSIVTHLNKIETADDKLVISCNGQYAHTQNMLIGTNRVATQAALAAARGLGYSSHVWSHSIQGEARELGELFATLAHNFLLAMEGKTAEASELQLLGNCSRELEKDLLKLKTSFHDMRQRNQHQFCLISGGEPTVTVTGSGKGGRNQEMALAFALRLNELRPSPSSHCVFVSVGTDGQDGPCDAAGAVVDCNVIHDSLVQNLSPVTLLENNDSYTYFSLLNGGRHLIKTGLTGTNVMDIHLLFLMDTSKICSCDHE